MTWNEILRDRSSNHSVLVSQLDKKARKRLAALKLDDIESLVSLRVAAKQRIWGIKQHNSLLLLWWDPGHQVCPSPPKHT